VDTTALAWPFGSHNAALTEDARKAGFETMENTWPGLNVADNDDASANVRRFGSDGVSEWSTIETTMRRWYVCQ